MPKIPTFKSTARPTAETASVTTDISVSPFRTMAGALRPLGQAAEDYYIRERSIKEKTEATKKYTELSTELDTIQEGASNSFDPQEAADTFSRQSQFLLKEKLSQVKNRRVRNMIQNKFDLDTFQRGIKIKEITRDRLDEEFRYNNKIERQQNLSKYRTAKTQQEREMIANEMLSNAETNGNYLGDKPLTIRQTKDSIKKDLFKIDFEKVLTAGNTSAALTMLSDIEGTPFLTDADRQGLQKELDKKLDDVNIDNVIKGNLGVYVIAGQVKNVSGKTVTQKDLENGMQRQAQLPNAKPSDVIKSSIVNNTKVPMYKTILVAGSSNISDTGDKNLTRQGLEYYRLFKIQNGLNNLKTTYDIDKETLQSYARIDFAMNVLKETFDSAYQREVQIKNQPENYKLRTVSDKKVDSKFGSLDMAGLFDPDIVNVQTTKNLIKNIANVYYKAGGTEDDALDGAREFIEQNYRIDLFGQIVPRDPSLPEYHDAAIKTYIKKLYDEGKINKETNKLDDIIPAYYSGGQLGDVQGFVLKNKNTGQPISIGPPDKPLGDFDEVSYDSGRLTQKQIVEKVYSLAEDQQYKNFVGKYNLLTQKRKRLFELARPEVKSGFGQPVE